MGYDDGSGNGAAVTCTMGGDPSVRSTDVSMRDFCGAEANTDGK